MITIADINSDTISMVCKVIEILNESCLDPSITINDKIKNRGCKPLPILRKIKYKKNIERLNSNLNFQSFLCSTRIEKKAK